MKLEFATGKASAPEIERHLIDSDHTFHPPLSSRVSIGDYSRKIAARAIRFEAWSGRALVGLVAAYCTDPNGGTAFVTNVSVAPPYTGLGIARQLMTSCRDYVSEAGFARLELEVDQGAYPALRLYQGMGFHSEASGTRTTRRLVLDLKKAEYRCD